MMKRSPRDNAARSSRRFFVTALVFIAAGYAILLSPFRDEARAVLTFLSRPLWTVSRLAEDLLPDTAALLRSKAALQEENRRMKEEISALRLERWKNGLIAEERDALLEFYGRRSDDGIALLAYVLQAPARAPYDTLLLDIGADAGLAPGDPIETEGGFVIGRLKSVSARESVAELHSSPGVTHDILIGSSRIPAVAHGVGAGNFRVDVPQAADVRPGDGVSFAGEGERLLGVVEHLAENRNTGITTLFLRLPVNIMELSRVFVRLAERP